MSKKKEDNHETYFRYVLEKNWNGVLEEVNEINRQIKKADKHDKKNLKKMKKSKVIVNFECSEGIRIRKKTLKMFKDSKFVDSMIYCLTHAGDILSLMKRAISVLIVSILSLESIRKGISKSTLEKINMVFRYTITC